MYTITELSHDSIYMLHIPLPIYHILAVCTKAVVHCETNFLCYDDENLHVKRKH